MKICQVTHNFLPRFVGGRMFHILDLSKALGEQGLEVEIITGDEVKKPSLESISENVSVIRLPMLSVPFTRGSSDVIYRIVPRLLFTLVKSNTDLIHAHDYFHFSSDISAWASKISGKPLVLTIHSRLGFFSVNKPLVVLEKVYNSSLGRATLNRAKRVIFMSRSSAREFLNKGLVTESKVEVIHPSIDVDEFNEAFDRLSCGGENFYAKKFGLKDNRIILSVGRIEKRKGLQYVLQAMPDLIREFPGLKLVVVGPDAGYVSELKHMATSLGVDQHVLFTGYLSDEEVKEAMFFADVFVLPSEHENYPEVALRAACLGRPIIASNTGGIPEFVEDGNTGLLVDVGDSYGFSDAIKRLLTDIELATKLGKNARDKVLREHTMRQMAAKTIKVYQEILEKG